MPSVKPENLEDWIGKALKPSDWFDITQPNIDAFADLTHDRQYIHCNPELAKNTLFGGTIAHAFYTLSQFTFFEEGDRSITVEDREMSLNYGFNKIRFMAPVVVGKRVRAHFKLIDVKEKRSGEHILTHEVTVEIEGEEKPAMVAEWLTMDLSCSTIN